MSSPPPDKVMPVVLSLRVAPLRKTDETPVSLSFLIPSVLFEMALLSMVAVPPSMSTPVVAPEMVLLF